MINIISGGGGSSLSSARKEIAKDNDKCSKEQQIAT